VAAVGENNALGYLVRRQIEPQRFEVTVRVVDLVDDHTLWEQSSPSSVGDDELTQWWHEHQNEVSSAFRRFGLVPLDDQLGEFPVILDEDYYAAYVRRSLAADTGLIHRLEVVVQSGRGVKTIFDAQGNWRWATLLGFIPSPFENRLAVVLLVQPEGWGGSQQPLRFIVTGASLKTGFVQP
jgi:hypothetical protein